ncbi:MAG: hypothetical protein J6Y08_10850 [Clostridiales bacterium]|nr:hypothetical protein [Clostridiales bacterium]
MDGISINNKPKKRPEDVRNCPKCGAPLLSEICQFCGTYIGEVATRDLTPEYPLVECKSAKVDFWNIGFNVMFGGIFAGVSIPMLIATNVMDEIPFYVNFFMLPFILFGLGSLWIAARRFFFSMKVKTKGTLRSGIVYGYMDDTVAYNGVNGQKIKILLDTAEGKKFILLPLGTTAKPYEVNSTVDVRLYEEWAVIVSKKTHNW